MAKISVVMSVYNEPPEWLRASIESMLNQTFTNFEFIIINDNPERSDLQEILYGYQNKDSRIRIVRNEVNLGITKSLNKALKLAAGKYIARMDADDISLPQRLQLQYEFLESRQEIFLVGSAVRRMNQKGKLLTKAIRNLKHQKIVKDIFAKKLAFYHPAIMFRNEGYYYREKFTIAQDSDFYLILLSDGKEFANLKDVLLYYRLSNRSISGTKRRQQIILRRLALKFYSERKTKGSDSYEIIDFQDNSQVTKFLNISGKELETRIMREKVIFALGTGDISAARANFNEYKKQVGWKFETFCLWLFTRSLRIYRLYRKVRYELLAG